MARSLSDLICSPSAMTLMHNTLETMPFEEIAEVLSRGASRVPGGPPALIDPSVRQLAAGPGRGRIQGYAGRGAGSAAHALA